MQADVRRIAELYEEPSLNGSLAGFCHPFQFLPHSLAAQRRQGVRFGLLVPRLRDS